MWVLLHGFSGSPASWDEVVELMNPEDPPLRPTLTGHGPEGSAACGPSFDEELSRLTHEISQSSRPRLLAGYSMGARVALGLLATRPALFDAAVLIGVHPGLTDEAARAERRAIDGARARQLRTEGIRSFVDSWEQQPLFETQQKLSSDVLEKQRTLRLGHDPEGLARAIEVLGLARMPDYGSELVQTPIPIILMAGSLDSRFADIARSFALRSRHLRARIIEGAGHNLLIEAPGDVASTLIDLETEVAR